MATDILDCFGGHNLNNLYNIICDEADNIKRPLISDSPYYSLDNIGPFLSNYNDKFMIMSLNCQSINSKYDNLIFIENIH